MKVARIALALAVVVTVAAGALHAAGPKDDATKNKVQMGGAQKPARAEYCDRGNAKRFCSGIKVKKELTKVNQGLRKEIQKYKQAEKHHLKVYGIDGWQEMYLEGQGLEGRHFSLTSGGAAFPVQKDGVLTDSNSCDTPVLQLKVDDCVATAEPASCTVEVVQGSSGICGQDSDVPAGVQIVRGYWDGSGAWHASDTEVTLSCNSDGNEENDQLPSADGAVARCVRYYRYKPGSNNDDLTACIRMQRADFCGDGVSHTFIGTYIDAHDQDDKVTPKQCKSDGMCFEASWNKEGAVCVGHARWTDLDYAQACPNRFPDQKDNGVHCRSAASITKNDLFTRSKINTCGSEPKSCGPDTVSPGCPPSSAKQGK